MELTYTPDENGILYLDLKPPMATEPDIGMWGRRRKKFLKEHRPWQYTEMKTKGTLFPHLAETNGCAEAMFTYMVPRLAAAKGASDKMKEYDQMLWVRMMNNARHSAEETVNRELIFV